LECKIYFATAIGVQNLFCNSDWSAKFILQQRLECKIYFAIAKIDNDPFFGNAPIPLYTFLGKNKSRHVDEDGGQQKDVTHPTNFLLLAP